MKQTNTDAWWHRLKQYLYDVLTQQRAEFTKLIVKWPAVLRAIARCGDTSST
jgi:hypothetical protein